MAQDDRAQRQRGDARARHYYEWVTGLCRSGNGKVTRAAGVGIALASHGNWGEGLWVAATTLAEEVGLDEKTVRTSLDVLVTAGWLTRKRRPGKTYLYSIATPEGFVRPVASDRTRNRPATPERNARSPQTDSPDDQEEVPRGSTKTVSDDSAVDSFIRQLVSLLEAEHPLQHNPKQINAVRSQIRDCLDLGYSPEVIQHQMRRLIDKSKTGPTPYTGLALKKFVERADEFKPTTKPRTTTRHPDDAYDTWTKP